MAKEISEFINNIIQKLNSTSCPENDEMNLWEMTIHQKTKNKNSIDGRNYSTNQPIPTQGVGYDS